MDNYVDDCIVFSKDTDTYIKDLRRVLSHLSAAGLTLHGSKYFLGKSKTTHLGFEYSADGATLSSEKTPPGLSQRIVRTFVHFYAWKIFTSVFSHSLHTYLDPLMHSWAKISNLHEMTHTNKLLTP